MLVRCPDSGSWQKNSPSNNEVIGQSMVLMQLGVRAAINTSSQSIVALVAQTLFILFFFLKLISLFKITAFFSPSLSLGSWVFVPVNLISSFHYQPSLLIPNPLPSVCAQSFSLLSFYLLSFRFSSKTMAASDVPCCEPMFWIYLVICIALVCFAGLMSGLTLGLMSLSLVDLEVLVKAGQPQDRRNAG